LRAVWEEEGKMIPKMPNNGKGHQVVGPTGVPVQGVFKMRWQI